MAGRPRKFRPDLSFDVFVTRANRCHVTPRQQRQAERGTVRVAEEGPTFQADFHRRKSDLRVARIVRADRRGGKCSASSFSGIAGCPRAVRRHGHHTGSGAGHHVSGPRPPPRRRSPGVTDFPAPTKRARGRRRFSREPRSSDSAKPLTTQSQVEYPGDFGRSRAHSACRKSFDFPSGDQPRSVQARTHAH